MKHGMWKRTYYVYIITQSNHGIWRHWKISQQNLLIGQDPFRWDVFTNSRYYENKTEHSMYAGVPGGTLVHVPAWAPGTLSLFGKPSWTLRWLIYSEEYFKIFATWKKKEQTISREATANKKHSVSILEFRVSN